MLHDHGAAEGAALVAHHVLEDAEFLGGEVDGFGTADHLAANAVEGELGHLQADVMLEGPDDRVVQGQLERVGVGGRLLGRRDAPEQEQGRKPYEEDVAFHDDTS